MTRSLCRPPDDSSDDARWSSIWTHHDELLALARRRVPTESDAEDVVHEAMALAAADESVELDRVGAWLNRVVRNRCVDLARERSYADKQVIYEAGRARVQSSTEDEVCDNAEAVFLAQVLETLPTRQHEALLHVADGWSNAQIAAAMSTTVKAIESLLVKARRTLRTAAAAAVVGLACLVRRPARSASSAAGLVALSVGLTVYALNPSAPGNAVRTAPHLDTRPEVVAVPAAAAHHAGKRDEGEQHVATAHVSHRTLSAQPSVQRSHGPHTVADVKAGPTHDKVSHQQYNSPLHPVSSTVSCVRSGVIVSVAYTGCANSPGRPHNDEEAKQ